ncbi:phosphatase PAP2 family protein [Hyphomicrobium sp.]|uniref:phosphatase PAP2 family protein n=1 Tax=Hyphomicrobium sp. TaxID=82 RepID=UPI003563695D
MTAENAAAWKPNKTAAHKDTLATAVAMFFGSAAVGICAALFFYIHPRFDLAVAELLHVSARRFIGSESVFFHTLRNTFSTLFYIVCVFAGLGCVVTVSTRKSWLTLSARSWLYLAVCLLIGPLTIANLGFKDHWGRPRPINVTEFGGKKAYEPPLARSDQCDRNCSFISGEASSIYIVCFSAAFLFPGEAALWTIAGVVLGSFAGFVRMAEGGHFLSDVLFAGVFMAMTAAVIHMLFAIVARDPATTG